MVIGEYISVLIPSFFIDDVMYNVRLLITPKVVTTVNTTYCYSILIPNTLFFRFKREISTKDVR